MNAKLPVSMRLEPWQKEVLRQIRENPTRRPFLILPRMWGRRILRIWEEEYGQLK